MSFQTYTIDSRDTKRKTDLGVIRKGLEIYQMKNQKLPDPDDFANISSGGILSLQGYAANLVLKTLRISDDAKDTKDNKYYTYSVSTDKTKYQLLAMLEKQENLAYNQKYINQINAIDYTRRYPYTIGQKIGIYLSGTTNTPIQEGNSGTILNVTNGSDYRIITENSGATSQTPRVNTCTSWTYSTGTCSIDGTAPLTVLISSPNGCTGGTPLTTTSCTYTCPTGYVLVPKDGIFTTQNFCVMKYEAKITGNDVGTTTYNSSMVAESRSSGTPWVNITQPQAITECNALGAGYHLITNNEWMTIARNIEANSQNWANGIVGSLVSAGGGLYRGNVNLNDSASCGSNTVLDGDTGGTNCDNGSGRNKRMHKLSNGNDIWDIAGNVGEYVNGTNNKSSIDGVVVDGNACSDIARHS
ncbi:MAG: hypothetical protein PHR68_04990, partial [Candidatus Gracilibacteria bacterium]|nr:hypothetical protein [Candidatus Gracilibacteria bacterium]